MSSIKSRVKISSKLPSNESKVENNVTKGLKQKSNTKGENIKKGWKQWFGCVRGKGNKEKTKRVKETNIEDNQRRGKSFKVKKWWNKLKKKLCSQRKGPKSGQKVTGVESDNTLTPPKCPLIIGEVSIELTEDHVIGNNCNHEFSCEDQGINNCVIENSSLESNISVAADIDIKDEDQSSETDPESDVQMTDISENDYFSDDSIPLALGIEEESNEQMVRTVDDFVDDISLEWDDCSAALELIGDYNRDDSYDGMIVVEEEITGIDVKQDINEEVKPYHLLEDSQPIIRSPVRRPLHAISPTFVAKVFNIGFVILTFIVLATIWYVIHRRSPMTALCFLFLMAIIVTMKDKNRHEVGGGAHGLPRRR